MIFWKCKTYKEFPFEWKIMVTENGYFIRPLVYFHPIQYNNDEKVANMYE